MYLESIKAAVKRGLSVMEYNFSRIARLRVTNETIECATESRMSGELTDHRDTRMARDRSGLVRRSRTSEKSRVEAKAAQDVACFISHTPQFERGGGGRDKPASAAGVKP